MFVKWTMRIASIALFVCGMSIAKESPSWHLENEMVGWKDEALAIKYFHHSEMQRQWAWHLLGTYRFKGEEHVLDFGCGDGKITAELAHFVSEGNVTGVDLSPSMIAFAQRCFPAAYYPNVTFKTASDFDFTAKGSKEKYDLICSFSVFHLIADPVPILKKFYDCLSDEGKVLLVVPTGNYSAIYQAGYEMFEKYQIKCPWNTSNTAANSRSMRSEEGCASFLAEAGFDTVSIVHLNTPTAFYNKQELLEFMLGTVTANWQIPLEIAEDFFNDLIDRLAQLDDKLIDSFGTYHLKLCRMEVVAEKAK